MAEYDLDKLFSAVDPVSVAEYVGMPMKKSGTKYAILCPSPDHDDKHFGSCFLTKYGFKCYACGEYGSIIDMVSLYEDVSKSEAIDIIAESSGDPKSFMLSKAESKRRFNQKKRELYKLLPDEDLKLIGLAPASTEVSVVKNIRSVYDDTPLEPHQYLEWIPDDSEDGGYNLVCETVTRNPLRDLALQDEDAYKRLIRDKCNETIDWYNLMIDTVKKKKEGVLLADIVGCVGTTEFIRVCKDIISHIQDILIEYGGEIPKRNNVFGGIKLQTIGI